MGLSLFACSQQVADAEYKSSVGSHEQMVAILGDFHAQRLTLAGQVRNLPPLWGVGEIMHLAGHEDAAQLQTRRSVVVGIQAHEEHGLNFVLNLHHIAYVQTTWGGERNGQTTDVGRHHNLRTRWDVYIAGQNHLRQRRVVEGDFKVGGIRVKLTRTVARNIALRVCGHGVWTREYLKTTGNEFCGWLRMGNFSFEHLFDSIAKAHGAYAFDELKTSRVHAAWIVRSLPQFVGHDPIG